MESRRIDARAETTLVRGIEVTRMKEVTEPEKHIEATFVVKREKAAIKD